MRASVGLDSRRAPEAGRSHKGDATGPRYHGMVFPDGGIADPQMSNEASDGLAPSTFDPSLEHSTDKVALFWQPPPYFSQKVSFVVCRGRRIIFLRGAVYDDRKG